MREGIAVISYREFQQLDLRVAKVVSVEGHPNADKLYVMKVDVGGGEIKQMIAGLKGHYTPEELAGKSIVVVNNLEPARLRGLESQGMLLAAQDGEKVIVLVPESEATPGSKVL